MVDSNHTRHENPTRVSQLDLLNHCDNQLSGEPESQPPVKEGRDAIGDLEPALRVWGEVAASKRRLMWMERFKEAGCGAAQVESFTQTLEDLTFKKVGQGDIEKNIVNLTWKKKISDEKQKLNSLKVRKEKWRKVIRERMDYENYLGGRVKEELDQLAGLAGWHVVVNAKLEVFAKS